MAKTKSTQPAEKKTAPTKAKKTVPAESKTADVIAPNRSFTLTIPAKDIESAGQRALVRAQKSMKADGFRPGKVPLAVVSERLGKTGLQEMILEDVLSKAYSDYIHAEELRPLTDPAVTPKSMEEGKDWEFAIEIAEAPELELGDYAKLVKAAPAAEHGDHDGHNHSEDELRQFRLQGILKHLLETVTVRVPELLLRRETEHRLDHLVRQLQQVNLGLDEYLKNIGKTREDLQQDYAISTLASLQVELLLAAVIREAKLSVSETELQEVVKARAAVRQPGQGITQQELSYLHSSLLKQKAIDHLLSL